VSSKCVFDVNHNKPFKHISNYYPCDYVQVVALLVVASVKPAVSTSTAGCPDLSSLWVFACDCHITSSSGNSLTVACGVFEDSMTDTNVTNLVGLISPTMPIDVIFIYNQPRVTRVPQGLTTFTNLKAVRLPNNGITSANGGDFNLPLLQEIQLQGNMINTISGNFVLASPFQSNGKGSAYFDLSNNAALTSLSTATFSLSADRVKINFKFTSLASVNGDAFTLSATRLIQMNLDNNKIASVSGKFNLTATDSTYGSILLYLQANQLTSLSPATFYLNGAYEVQLLMKENLLTSVTEGQITLKSTQTITLDLSSNQLSSVKMAPDTNPPLKGDGQGLLLDKNNFNGTLDCNDLGINNGTAQFYLSVRTNPISGAKCGAGTLLDTAELVYMDWSGNAFTSLPAGSFNFAGKVDILNLKGQALGTFITSIEPGSLPRKILSIITRYAPLNPAALGHGPLSLRGMGCVTFNPVFIIINSSSIGGIV